MKRKLCRIPALILVLALLLPVSAFGEDNQSSYPYYELSSVINLPDGGYSLSTKNIGLKTIFVNQALLGSTNARYTGSTQAAVSRFQAESGLEATGEVDLTTWLALGYTEDMWNTLGIYTHPVLTTKYSTREDIVNAMLQAAKENADNKTAYRVGCSGPAGSYTDCSGLIFQCLYAAGINPEKNIVDHALAEYEYTSRNLAADERLGVNIPQNEVQAGDLVFYHHNGVVCHVGIMTSNTYMYDSWPNKGVTHRKASAGGSVIAYKRVLPDYDAYHESPNNAVSGIGISAGSNSCILFNLPGAYVSGDGYSVLVLVNPDGVIENITLSQSLTVPENGYILAATGAKADWIINELRVGDKISIEGFLIFVTQHAEPSQPSQPLTPPEQAAA